MFPEKQPFSAGDRSMTFLRPSSIQERTGVGFSAQRDSALAGNIPTHSLRL
jgi:hypothetical protein